MKKPEDGAPRMAPHSSRPIEQTLPFSVHVVTTEEQLLEVQALRSQAYGHHLPLVAESFGRADPIDRERDTTIFYARDKATGRMVGSARIQTNRYAPLQIERSVQLPPQRLGQRLAEITRLTVLPGYEHPVRMAMVKASYVFCVGMQVAGIMAGSRRSLVRQYSALGFTDLFEDERMVPLLHAGGMEHRILFVNLITAESEWRQMNHPAYGFIFHTYHPDIAIFETVSAAMSHERAQATAQAAAAAKPDYWTRAA
ncbi:hypothetical protein BH09PSE5_BH09PSE5_12940 [soil metagenome]